MDFKLVPLGGEGEGEEEGEGDGGEKRNSKMYPDVCMCGEGGGREREGE